MSKRVLLARPACVACGRRATNCHHVLPKAHGGDDLPEALAPLCGSGSTGCHGALHGNDFVDDSGYRWTADDVRCRIGEWVVSHPGTVRYVLGKLGEAAGRDYLERCYGVLPGRLPSSP